MKTNAESRSLSEKYEDISRRTPTRILAFIPFLALFLLSVLAKTPVRGETPAAPPSTHSGATIEQLHARTVPLRLLDGVDIRFRKIPSRNGLSQTRVGATVQDSLGFLWFGTQSGLNRFDGYKFKVFRHQSGQPNSLSGVYVRALFVDHTGTLWVSCDQALDRFDPVTETFTHFRVGTKGTDENYGPAVHISEDPDGRLWLATAKGLFMLDPATGRTIRYLHEADDPSSLSGIGTTFTGEDRRGTFWVANDGGLDALDRKTGKVTLHLSLAGHIATMFHEDEFGVFWVVNTSPQCPLAVLDRNNKTFNCFAIFDYPRRTSAIAGIYSVLESRDGTMWMASEGAGLLKYDRARNLLVRYVNHPGDNDSLGANSVIALFEDNESNIWLDLHETVPYSFSERQPPFENFTHARGNLKGSLVTSIFEDRRRILWIGSTGALNRIDRATGSNLVPPEVGVRGEVLSILEDHSGTVVAGTFRQGLQRLDPATGKAQPYVPGKSDHSDQSAMPIMRIVIDHAGTLWAATWGGLRRFDSTKGEFTETYKPDFRDTVAYSDIKEDPSGALWLGGESGLQRFDPKSRKFTIYKHDPEDPHSVSDHRVTSVFFDHAGRMWLGTQDGLDRFDPNSGTAKVYYEKDGLAGNVVSCILEDERGSLWMGTNNGLSSFDPQTQQFRNYSVDDGLPGPDLTGWSTCFKSPRGEMFFGGFSGATAFYPGKLSGRSFIPKTVLTDFRLAGNPVVIGPSLPLHQSITYTKSITLSHEQNVFSIEFSALSNFDAMSNHYRYRLEGLESQWHEVGSDQRVASYTTLPSGKYTFHVEGATGRGAWDEPGATLEIAVLAPWWGTWWFTASYIALILCLILSVYLYRLHRIRLEFNARWEERVNERTRLARELHDTLLQTIQSTKMIADDALIEMKTLTGMQVTMKSLSNWLGQASEEGRAVLDSLRHTATDDDGLLEALQRVAGEFEDRTATKLRLSVIGSIPSMNSHLVEEVYRIACEGIRNAYMHSEGSRIEVEVRYAKEFTLRISDNGKGISQKVAAEGKKGHFGLQGMRERAIRIGGKLDLVTSALGTEITLRIPGVLIFNDADSGVSNLLTVLQTWRKKAQR